MTSREKTKTKQLDPVEIEQGMVTLAWRGTCKCGSSSLCFDVSVRTCNNYYLPNCFGVVSCQMLPKLGGQDGGSERQRGRDGGLSVERQSKSQQAGDMQQRLLPLSRSGCFSPWWQMVAVSLENYSEGHAGRMSQCGSTPICPGWVQAKWPHTRFLHS